MPAAAAAEEEEMGEREKLQASEPFSTRRVELPAMEVVLLALRVVQVELGLVGI